jgi:hypothetical protein
MSGPDCEHRHGDTCAVASRLSGRDAQITVSACAACVAHDAPRTLNGVTVSLAAQSVKHDPARMREILDQHGAHLVTATGPTRAEMLAAIRTGNGPGSQLWRLLAELGIAHREDCACIARAYQMNAWGPQGCRDHRAEIVHWMKQGAGEYGWTASVNAACKAARSGLLWRLDIIDPYGSLVDEAIRRAELAGAEPVAVARPTPLKSAAAAAAAVSRPPVQRLILQTNLCPGDLLTLTAALESLHLTYPGEYQTDVRTNHPQIWTANPWITRIADSDRSARVVPMHYPSIGRCNQEHIPFLGGYVEYLGEQIGRPLRLRTNRPHLYLTPDEERRPRSALWHGAPDLSRPFWIVNAGIKQDYTCKAWPLEYYQEIVDRTAGRIQWVQIGLRHDWHRPLRGVIDLLDSGPPMRETILLARHAAGGLGPITFLQHLCAAWQIPYIALVGGREPATWVSYPKQATLHTVGALDCCRDASCWKARVVPLGDGDSKDNSLCRYPVTENLERPAPRCMAMIEPVEVLTILERYHP